MQLRNSTHLEGSPFYFIICNDKRIVVKYNVFEKNTGSLREAIHRLSSAQGGNKNIADCRDKIWGTMFNGRFCSDCNSCLYLYNTAASFNRDWVVGTKVAKVYRHARQHKKTTVKIARVRKPHDDKTKEFGVQVKSAYI